MGVFLGRNASMNRVVDASVPETATRRSADVVGGDADDTSIIDL